MSVPQAPDQPANFSRHVLLVVGDVPHERIQPLSAQVGLTSFVRITARQACLDLYQLADIMRGADGDKRADAETIRQYFLILSGGYTPEVVGGLLMDEDSWEDPDNLLVSGVDALFPELPVAVYKVPQFLQIHTKGPLEPTVEIMRI